MAHSPWRSQQSLIKFIISPICTCNEYLGPFHADNLWIEIKMFYTIHHLERENSVPLSALTPCSFGLSSNSRTSGIRVLAWLSSFQPTHTQWPLQTCPTICPLVFLLSQTMYQHPHSQKLYPSLPPAFTYFHLLPQLLGFNLLSLPQHSSCGWEITLKHDQLTHLSNLNVIEHLLGAKHQIRNDG